MEKRLDLTKTIKMADEITEKGRTLRHTALSAYTDDELWAFINGNKDSVILMAMEKGKLS